MKHDPSYLVSKSMKHISVKSDQRLHALRGNKAKFLHARFNLDVLTTSPLMAFPHFQDMTAYLTRWFETRDERQKKALNSHQRATFRAQERFSNGLFLLLQESARAAPVSPKPLKGIYNWYLLRDSVINQNTTVEKKTGLEEFVVIELSNGQEIRIPRMLIDPARTTEIEALFRPEAIKYRLRKIEVDPEAEFEVPPQPVVDKKTEVIISTELAPPLKKAVVPQARRVAYNFDRLQAELKAKMGGDRGFTIIQKMIIEKRRADMAHKEAWE
jgi:hypothetical protein